MFCNLDEGSSLHSPGLSLEFWRILWEPDYIAYIPETSTDTEPSSARRFICVGEYADEFPAGILPPPVQRRMALLNRSLYYIAYRDPDLGPCERSEAYTQAPESYVLHNLDLNEFVDLVTLGVHGHPVYFNLSAAVIALVSLVDNGPRRNVLKPVCQGQVGRQSP